MSAVDFVSQIPLDDMNYFILLEELGGREEHDQSWMEHEVRLRSHNHRCDIVGWIPATCGNCLTVHSRFDLF